ncbi:M20/M25/M40 family metallo-hydrolase [Robertkochia marina]|uniref:M20/M25/M40 family metallo-hydrolase n=1 Tax=Robertkochia marina TaxID=1227945 RepID=A0A4S3LZ12_9FLAO|nr:M20/M25/M40 family metallo-hydrolase [Robertkochia marina]THD66391.1 M20/M25/M40 family metallo-hydrolase [Robertkochia marina]TRZ44070.1 M20/M25/M40 family metallo-hydrolase [Robertkochia marina]
MKNLLLLSVVVASLFSAELKAQKVHPGIVNTISEIREFVSIPNDANDMDDMKDNLIWLKKAFAKRGFSIMELPTSNVPLFFANGKIKEDRPTVLFYMHFDGQAVDPSKWEQANPYKVVIKEASDEGWTPIEEQELNENIDLNWRLFGRSVSDDKGPIVMFLNAWDELKAKGITPSFNVKVILDGEEEKSSKPLPEAVNKYRELFEADLLVINDGPVHASGKPTLVYGCRGITTLSLTSYGPIKPQHSGHFGNYAPNPGLTLAHALSSLKDQEGKVVVPGFYDGIEMTSEIQAVLDAVPENEQALKDRLQIAATDKVASSYQGSLQYPSLNIRGLSSGWTGEKARTIIPEKATAEIDIRLVPETPGQRQKDLIKDYLRSKGYYITTEEPDREMRMTHKNIIKVEEGSVTDAFRTSMNSEEAEWARETLKTAFNEAPVEIRIMGGTVPIAPFINTLEVPAIIIPMVNPDNNQHSPNENISLERVNYGLQVFEALLSSSLTGI